MSNIDCDQKMRPLARSQSHRPQRPRLSAVSMRLCTVSSIVAVSRIRRDCHRNAKPSISTTKPVAENSVTASVVSARHSASTAERRCVIASWPIGVLMSRSASRMREPSVSVTSVMPAPSTVAGVAGSRPIASLSLRPT